MIILSLLEDTDILQETDWCRPLVLYTMSNYSESYSFKSCYTGKPENNLKWCQVKDALPFGWAGRTVGEFNSRVSALPYEFIRGNIPQSDQLDMKLFK